MVIRAGLDAERLHFSSMEALADAITLAVWKRGRRGTSGLQILGSATRGSMFRDCFHWGRSEAWL